MNMYRLQSVARLQGLAVIQRVFRRSLQVAATRNAAFEVKDEEEFQSHVLKSPLPVVVAFHAVYVRLFH